MLASVADKSRSIPPEFVVASTSLTESNSNRSLTPMPVVAVDCTRLAIKSAVESTVASSIESASKSTSPLPASISPTGNALPRLARLISPLKSSVVALIAWLANKSISELFWPMPRLPPVNEITAAETFTTFSSGSISSIPTAAAKSTTAPTAVIASLSSNREPLAEIATLLPEELTAVTFKSKSESTTVMSPPDSTLSRIPIRLSKLDKSIEPDVLAVKRSASITVPTA